jgi:hypothetical protein
MTIIEEYYLSADFTTMYAKITVPVANQITKLYLYIGDAYLNENPVILDAYIQPSNPSYEYQFSVNTPEIAAVYNKDVFDGPFTIVVETDEGPDFITGKTLINAYYAMICLANKTLALDDEKKMNELFMLHLYIKAAITYVTAGQTEQALGAWDKVEAVVENSGDDFLNIDVSPCGEGSGCWIIGGVYVVKY